MENKSNLGSGTTLGKAIEQFLRSPAARLGMRIHLSRLVVLCGSGSPLFTLAAGEMREYLGEVKKVAERRKRIEALNCFFEYAQDQGWVQSNPAAAFVKMSAPKKKGPSEKSDISPRKVIQLSVEGREVMEAEVEELKRARERVIEEVKTAREDGDLKENAPYHAARERLAMIEGRLRESIDTLARAIPLE